MASQISFGSEEVLLNNMQFAGLVDFAIEHAERSIAEQDLPIVDRMKTLREVCWPGRGIDIAEDIPLIDDRKFWCEQFFDVARAIFDRSIGDHTHSFWQAGYIHRAMGVAYLLQQAVRTVDEKWTPDCLDYREFDRIVNGIRK